MRTRNLALGIAVALVAGTAFAQGAGDRHPSGSSPSGGSSAGSSGGSSSGGSSGGSTASSPSQPSGGQSFAGSSRHSGRSGSSSTSQGNSGHRGRGGREGRGGGRVRVYGPYGGGGYGMYGSGLDYYYGGAYGGYYDGYYGYGWRGSYPGYHYVYDANYGSLRIMVEPDDTEVYVDGYFAGDVDSFNGIFQRLHVKPGRHEITLKRAGYRTHRLRLYIPIGATMKIRHDMERGPNLQPTEAAVGQPEVAERPTTAREEADESAEAGDAGDQAELTLTVRPADAAVYVDGIFRGNAKEVGPLDLDAGKHRIDIVRPGFATYQKDITLRPGQEADLRIDLQRVAGEL